MSLLEKRMQCMVDRLGAQQYAEGRSCREMNVEMDCRGWGGVMTYVAQNDCEVEFLSDKGWVVESEVEEKLSLIQSLRKVVNKFSLVLNNVSEHIFAEISRD